MITFGKNIVTVKKLSEIAKVDPETIRRGIRNGKIIPEDSHPAKKNGYAIDIDRDINKEYLTRYNIYSDKYSTDKDRTIGNASGYYLTKEQCETLKANFMAINAISSSCVEALNQIKSIC